MLARLAEKVQQAKLEYERCYGEASNRVSITTAVKGTHEALKKGILFKDDFETPQQQKSMEKDQEVDDHWSTLDFNDQAVEEAIQMAKQSVVRNADLRDFNEGYGTEILVNETIRTESMNNSISTTHAKEKGQALPSEDVTPSEYVSKSIVLREPMGIVPHYSPQLVEPVSARKGFVETSLTRHWKSGQVFGEPQPQKYNEFDVNMSKNTTPAATSERNREETYQIHNPEGAVMALPAAKSTQRSLNTSLPVTKNNPIHRRNTRARYPSRAISSPFDGAKTDMERTLAPLEDKTIQYIFDRKIQTK